MIYGVGIVGSGDYSRTKSKSVYLCWFNMLTRCYGNIKNENYKDCIVCDDWLGTFDKESDASNAYIKEKYKILISESNLQDNLKIKNGLLKHAEETLLCTI